MQPAFMILGADGKQYGPVTADQFAAWAREGRVNGETQVRTEDSQTWMPAASVPQLGAAPVASAAAETYNPAQPVYTAATTDPAVAHRIKNGVSWFYWIAGLSVVNSILALTGAGFRFFFGLGVTQVVDALASSIEGPVQIVALLFNAVVAAIFVLLGVFSGKRHSWAFIVGLILVALDGVLAGLFRDWISVAFHVFVLYVLFNTFQVHRSAA